MGIQSILQFHCFCWQSIIVPHFVNHVMQQAVTPLYMCDSFFLDPNLVNLLPIL